MAKRGADRIVPTTRLVAALVAGVAIAVLIVHWPVLSARALSFDDSQYLVDNDLVRNPSWSAAWRFTTEVLKPSTVRGYYQPLTMLSLMLDTARGGSPDALVPFHATSLALHVANTCLVVVLLTRLFGNPWAASVVGLVFGLHPLTVEPIPWVSERKTLLAAFFGLWCLVFYVEHARASRRRAYLLSLTAFVLALLAKPTGTFMPLLLLLLDAWPLRRLDRSVVREKLPFFAIAAVSAIVTVASQARAAVVAGPAAFPASRIPLIFFHNLLFYPLKMVWPAQLSSHYPFPEPFDLGAPMVQAGAIWTCLVIVLLVWSLRFTRAFVVGALLFFVAVFPTMGVIAFTNVIASDKYVYLPVFGLLMSLCWWLASVWRRAARADAGGWQRRAALGATLVVVLVAESVATRRQLAHWRDTETLMRYMLSLTPHAPTLHYSLGDELRRQGRSSEAIAEYRETIALKPDAAWAYNNLGNMLGEAGRLDEAMPYWETALELTPDDYRLHANLGVALAMQGHPTLAVARYHEALAIAPDSAEVLANLGVALLTLGRVDEAIVALERCVALKPGLLPGRRNLAAALTAAGRISDARVQYRQVLPAAATALARSASRP